MTNLFTLLGKKWSIFIIHAVESGNHTFTGIRSHTGNPNTKILTDRLSELVDERILEKSEASYQLSPLGKKLAKKISELGIWWSEQKE
jgi:DNA-binding HxlR family transcriptional regulator